MKRALLVLVASCASPAPSSLKPNVDATDDSTRLYVYVDFAGGDPGVDVRATFRGETRSMTHHDQGSYTLLFRHDTPIASDEALTVDVDGVSMTMTAPTAYDSLQVPLFVSRSQDTTVTWSPPSSDEMAWYVPQSVCASSQGGTIPANAASVTFTRADWTPPPIPTRQPTCTTDVRLLRNREMPIDAAFAGGHLGFERIVDVQFASTP